ncbi:MAG: hypothetical protein ACR2PZ_09215 [Pseudomonadales bacterium]
MPRPQQNIARGLRVHAFLLVLIASPALAQQTAANHLRFDRAIILDTTGFQQPLAASTMFIPHGWQVQGGVVWGQQYVCTNGYAVSWTATSPDAYSQIAILPQIGWQSNNYGAPPSQGCAAANHSDAASYLRSLAQQWRPGARVLDFRRRPDLERELGVANTTTPMPMGDIRTWTEAGEVLFAFNDRGRDMRGSISGAVSFNFSRTDAGLGTGTMNALIAIAYPAYAVVAPNGNLDLKFYEGLRRTLKANPQWTAQISQHNRKMSGIALQGARERAQITANSNRELARIRDEAWNSYQQSSDRRAREFTEYIREVETYADANAPGGTVELSQHYQQAWKLDDGSYVLSNDVNFEPWKDLGINGAQLEAAP